MASTKTATTLQASATNTAGSTTNSSVHTGTTDYGSAVIATITNGGTGPTLPCTAYLQVSNDNSTFYPSQSGTAGTTASTTYTFTFIVDPTWLYHRVQFVGNTAQSVTVVAINATLTTI